MFKKHSLQVKVVKDTPRNPTTMDEIKAMSPEELEEATNRMLRQIAFRIGTVVVAKVAITIILSAAVKRMESK